MLTSSLRALRGIMPKASGQPKAKEDLVAESFQQSIPPIVTRSNIFYSTQDLQYFREKNLRSLEGVLQKAATVYTYTDTEGSKRFAIKTMCPIVSAMLLRNTRVHCFTQATVPDDLRVAFILEP